MANFEEEARSLREKNSELVQEVQYWKLTAAQREKEKLELMKDINELRLKLTRLRSGGAAQARKLDAALQVASEEALSHLVQASGAVTRTIELAKQYMRDRQEFDDKSPRWSNISGPSSTEKVHRVPPLLIGGQSIQPVVSLSRTMFNSSTRSRSPNNVTERAVPMRMLQDVYIPLTRIDMTEIQTNNMETNADNSADDLGLEDSSEQPLEDSQNLSEEFDASRRLDAVMEDLEFEDQVVTPPRSRVDNPLEGPSWLLDVPIANQNPPMVRINLEPDSTTMFEEAGSSASVSPALLADQTPNKSEAGEPAPAALAFTPTVRRRKRSPSPPRAASPPAPAPTHKHNNSNRVLKVLVAKMPLSGKKPAGGCGDASPPKRAAKAPTRSAIDALESFEYSPRSPEPSPRSPKRSPRSPEHSPRNPEHSPRNPELSPRGSEPTPRSPKHSPRSPEHMSRSPEPTPRGPEHTPPRRLASPPPKRAGCDASTPKRPMRFEAPSPNGATDARVIVIQHDSFASGEPAATARCDSRQSRDGRSHSRQSQSNRSRGRDSDSEGSVSQLAAEGRSRRARKAVTYKEKPLNRKLRR